MQRLYLGLIFIQLLLTSVQPQILQTVEETLPDMGGGCLIKETEDGDSVYDCSFQCFYEAENWDNDYSSKKDWRCQALADNSCGALDKYDEFNFFHVCYCWLGGYLWLYLPISIIVILLIFMFSKASVEGFLEPSLSYLALDYFKMSENVAGVTFIAIANGANDVIVALISGSGEGGVSYNIGALFGSGLFVGALVIAMTIFICPNTIQVSPELITRDIPFYIFSTLMVLVFACTGYIYWWSAALFLVIYVVLVATVIFQDRKHRTENEHLVEEKKQKIEQLKQNFSGSGKRNSLHQNSAMANFRAHILLGAQENIQLHHVSSGHKKKILALLPDYKGDKKEQIKQDNEMDNNKAIQEELTQSFVKSLTNQSEIKKLDKQDDEDEDEQKFADMGCWDKSFFIINYPFDIIRKLTIPPAEHDSFNKKWLIACPPFFLLFFFWIFKIPMLDYAMIGLPIGVFFSIVLFFERRHKEDDEIPKYFPIIAICAALAGLGWNYVMSEMLVDLLSTYIAIMKLDQTFMGLTVLGIGNALDDALTTLAFAKKGNVNMAITSGYAGQLFGLLVGFGAAQLKTTLINGKQEFQMFYDVIPNLLDLVVISVFLVTLVFTLIYSKKNNNIFGKQLGYILGLLYSIMVVAAFGIQIWFIITDANIKS